MLFRNIHEIYIRPATNKDREKIVALISNILSEYGLQFDAEGSDADLEDIETTYIDSGGSFEIVEDKNGNLLGTIGIHPLSESECKLRKMYLVRHLRGIGLGKYMLERSIETARKTDFKIIVLETVGSLRQAICLYRRTGFQRVNRKAASPRCDQVYALNLD